jgi:ATP-binding cassette subfamily F protein 3
MELVADRLWLAADGTIVPFEGDMDDYARFVLDRAKGGSAPSQMRAGKASQLKGEKSNQSRNNKAKRVKSAS